MSRCRFGTTIAIFLTFAMRMFCTFASRPNRACTMMIALGVLLSSGRSITFRLDKSLPTTTLLPSVPQSTQLLRRNHTTLTKYNLVSSITIRRRHCQIGHGNISKIILQLRGDLLTPHLQRLPTKSRLRRTSSSRRPLISVTNNQKNSFCATI